MLPTAVKAEQRSTFRDRNHELAPEYLNVLIMLRSEAFMPQFEVRMSLALCWAWFVFEEDYIIFRGIDTPFSADLPLCGLATNWREAFHTADSFNFNRVNMYWYGICL